MAKKLISINLDPIVAARVDTKTPHYWDIKRRRVIRGADEDDGGRRVLIDTIPLRTLRKLVTDFRKIVDSSDHKSIDEVLKGGLDKLPKLFEKRPDLDKAWRKQAGAELARAAVDWLALQGIEKFSPAGDMSRYLARGRKKLRDEEE
ncbi:MAG: hypothetical protein BroJett014_13250 [Planctomycetota bacterium]|nr:hypothetical protein [Planctomycetota bacterium]GIK52352.1 MAG: hypothetical protein BroJett014_13250 [Planctomycetota bacterium]